MGRSTMRGREDEVLDAFCAALAISDGAAAKIAARPDRDRPGKGGCEAIVRRMGKDFAVEHTTIDSFPGQRLDDARLTKVLDPAARIIAREFPGQRISVGVPIGAIEVGRDWSILTNAFARIVIASVRAIPPGCENAVVDPPGLFELTIFQRVSDSPGCFIVRDIDPDIMVQRVAVITRALEEKQDQLRPYRAAGCRTVVLLDNDDIGLMEPNTVAKAFHHAAETTSLADLDEVYLVDSTMRPPWFFPLKLGARRVPDLSEFREFHRQQYVQTFGTA